MIAYWLVRLLVLLIALAVYEKGIRLFKRPALSAPRSVSLSLLQGPKGPQKGANYVESTIPQQQLLQMFEAALLAPQVSTRSAAARSTLDRWSNAAHIPIKSFPESVLHQVVRMICHSSGLCSKSGNSAITELVPNALFGLKSDTRIIFAFRMHLETEPCSAVHFRIKLHNHFKNRLWPSIKDHIDFSGEQREIIFTGYNTGAALASLAAWHTINHFELFRPTRIVVTNANNQVKLITWDETPLYTHQTAVKAPLLQRNHLAFTTSTSIDTENTRKITQHSGGAFDEAQFFSISPADRIDIKADDYDDFAFRSSETCSKYSCKIASFFIKTKHLDSLQSKQRENLISLLKYHQAHFAILASLIPAKTPQFLVDSITTALKLCADAVAKHLETSVFPGSSISCRVDNYNQSTENFQLLCSYRITASTPDNPLTAQFLTLDAVLGSDEAFRSGNPCRPFMQEIQIPKETKKSKKKDKKKKKQKSNTVPDEDSDLSEEENQELTTAFQYIGPVLDTDQWSNCLYSLFEQKASQLSLISPFSVSEDQAYLPRCTYIPTGQNLVDNLGTRNRRPHTTGCYLRTVNLSQELLQIFRSDPKFFYKTIDTATMKFPKVCQRHLFPIPFKVVDQPKMGPLQQMAVNYLTELVALNPILRTEVDLWRIKDTNSFNTLALLSTPTTAIPEKDLFNADNYELDFENNLIKCLSSPSYPYRDCSNPINRWIPFACPAACSQTHGKIDFMCKNVKSCPNAGYFVSISSSGSVEELSSIHSDLARRSNPHFALYHVQARTSRYAFVSSTEFNVALFRLPSQRIL